MSPRFEILLAEDESSVRRGLVALLSGNGFGVRAVPDGTAALGAYRSHRPDLLLLDVMMPGLSGLEVCRAVREVDGETPILFLTALDTEADEIRGLGMGADDYVSKGATSDVLLARIAAALRRGVRETAADFSFAGWTVRSRCGEMARDGVRVALTLREIEFLRLLAAHPGEIFSTDFLLTRFWVGDVDIAPSALVMLVRRLRGKFSAGGRAIETVWGRGYRYAPEKDL